MRLLSLTLALGLSAVASAHSVVDYDDEGVCYWDTCEMHESLVETILETSGGIDFCHQLLPSEETPEPVTVTVTDAPRALTVVETLYNTHTSTVDKYATIYATTTETFQATVTDTISSSAVVRVDFTVGVTDVHTSTVIATQTITNTHSATTTNTVVVTDIDTLTDYTTSTVTVTATPTYVNKRDSRDIPEQLRSYDIKDLREACSCLPAPTVYTTVVAPRRTETRTIILPTTVPATHTVTVTKDVTDSITNTATVDVTKVITRSSSAIITKATTIDTTVTATVDQTVDVTVTETATATITDSQTVTITQGVTVTTTVTPTPTCGVNLIQNPVFSSLTLPPWTVSTTGASTQLYNSGCGVSTYCILFYMSSTGTFTISQSIDTFVGQTYTASFSYHTWASPYAGTSVTCSVNNGATSWPVSLTVSTATWATFSQTFVATTASNTFTCVGTTTTSFRLNMDAFSVEC